MNNDIATLAREVLGGDDASEDRFLDFFEARAIAQHLARAVLRVADLADDLENQGHRDLDSASLAIGTAGMVEVAAADRIRAALNGGRK